MKIGWVHVTSTIVIATQLLLFGQFIAFTSGRNGKRYRDDSADSVLFSLVASGRLPSLPTQVSDERDLLRRTALVYTADWMEH